MRSDTVAKLLYDLRHRPAGFEPPAAGTTIVIDEAGMLNTADLHQLINHTDTHGWRPRSSATHTNSTPSARGGMFDELCATGLTIELDQLHRFTHDWEAAATLQLRRGDASVLNDYADHRAIIAGSFDEHLAGVVNEWRWHQTMNTTLAVTTTRNDDVNALNDAIQADRLERGDLDAATATPLSIGVGHPGDVITTRRNDRRLITSTGDIVRNRDRWTINSITADSGLVVTSLDGDRTGTLPADYVTEHVHLGYAATEHGAQGETAHASLTIVTDATTNRGLYVGATRGRNTNLILTVADDRDHALQRLTHIITNDRTDLPATVQRRHLLQDQTQPRPTRKPRCDIPDWFNGVYADARTEALQLRSRADKKEDAQVQRQRAATEAESELPTAETAHAPFAQSVAASRQRVTAAANAKRSAWWRPKRSVGSVADPLRSDWRRRLPLSWRQTINSTRPLSRPDQRRSESITSTGPSMATATVSPPIRRSTVGTTMTARPREPKDDSLQSRRGCDGPTGTTSEGTTSTIYRRPFPSPSPSSPTFFVRASRPTTPADQHRWQNIAPRRNYRQGSNGRLSVPPSRFELQRRASRLPMRSTTASWLFGRAWA